MASNISRYTLKLAANGTHWLKRTVEGVHCWVSGKIVTGQTDKGETFALVVIKLWINDRCLFVVVDPEKMAVITTATGTATAGEDRIKADLEARGLAA